MMYEMKGHHYPVDLLVLNHDTTLAISSTLSPKCATRSDSKKVSMGKGWSGQVFTLVFQTPLCNPPAQDHIFI